MNYVLSIAVELILLVHLLDVLLFTLHRFSFRMINKAFFKNHVLKNFLCRLETIPSPIICLFAEFNWFIIF